jgi:hypothetical protein
MKSFIESLRKPEPCQVPQTILNLFTSLFPEAYNPDWSEINSLFEVIFYQKGIECIAGFDPDGSLKYVKRNLKLGTAPDVILKFVDDKWELMNILEINQNGQISYECIVRNNELIRFVVYIDSTGNISYEEEL